MRPIDADALKVILNKAEEECERDWFKGNEFREMIDITPTIEAEPVKQDTELSIILQDYGIKDTDTLRYILDQYQKIIVDITGGQMSYLTYPAETVIACADDNYRKCYEESMKHGRWFGTVCTNCGSSDCNYFDHDYCPFCGARMDGDSDGR